MSAKNMDLKLNQIKLQNVANKDITSIMLVFLVQKNYHYLIMIVLMKIYNKIYKVENIYIAKK